MKNLNKCVSVIALSIYFMAGVQQAEATKRINLTQDDDRPSKISKKALQDILKEIKESGAISPILLKSAKDLSMAELKSYEATLTIDHELFDSWIGLILTTFPNDTNFNVSLERARVKAESEQATLESQTNLASMYQHGQGVARDLTKAVDLFTNAANQGFAVAQFSLGMMYERGEGVTRDSSKAVEWFTNAANQGFALAQIKLGMMYERGQGVARDLTKAVDLFTNAANQGSALAQIKLGMMYERGQGVARDLTKAVDLFTNAANQGFATAHYNLGMMYERGQGVARDLTKAFDLFTKAASQGDAAGQNHLASMYQTGQGVARDQTKAVDLFTKAANQGFAAAQYNLGMTYHYGQGVAQDSLEALKYYFRSNENKNLQPHLRNYAKRATNSLAIFVPSTSTPDQKATYQHKTETLEDMLKETIGIHMLQQGRNNPNSDFIEAAFAIPSLFDTYGKIVDYEDILLKVVIAHKDPGFMTACLQPTDENRDNFKASRCSEIKYYEIDNRSFLTFGQKNIEIADKVMEMASGRNIHSMFFQPVQEIIELHKQRKRNYQIHALEIQERFRDGLIPQDQLPEQKEAIDHQNTLIDQESQEIEALTKLSAIPQQLQELLLEGVPYRNKLFLQNNAHIASLFED